MEVQTLSDLFRHMEWADAAVWSAVLASEHGRTDTKLRDYLQHLHIVQRAFLRTWGGEPRDTPYPKFDDVQALMEWGRSYYADAHGYLRTLTDTDASQSMPVAWAKMVEQLIGRVAATTTLGETVLQVALHSLYHRGQVNARLREVGGKPPLVDYIAWVWFGRPPAEWPSLIAPGCQ